MNLSSTRISTQNHQFICFRHALHCILEGQDSLAKSVHYAHVQIQRGELETRTCPAGHTLQMLAWQLQT